MVTEYLNQLFVTAPMFLVSFCFHHRLDRLLAFLIKYCSHLLQLVNMPLIDLTFAISATSLSADATFRLMKATINDIVFNYDIFRIHHSVIVFGNVITTRIDFSTNIPDKETLIRRVANLPKLPGPVRLVLALEDAKRVYRLQEVRPEARRFLVVIMDNESTDNVDNVTRAVTDLDSQDVVVIGVSIGNSTNSNDFEIITKDPRHIITAGVNKSPPELAKEIIDAIFISVKSKSFFFLLLRCKDTFVTSILHLPFQSFIHVYPVSFTCIPSYICIFLHTHSLGSLSTRVIERRTATGREHFTL